MLSKQIQSQFLKCFLLNGRCYYILGKTNYFPTNYVFKKSSIHRIWRILKFGFNYGSHINIMATLLKTPIKFSYTYFKHIFAKNVPSGKIQEICHLRFGIRWKMRHTKIHNCFKFELFNLLENLCSAENEKNRFWSEIIFRIVVIPNSMKRKSNTTRRRTHKLIRLRLLESDIKYIIHRLILLGFFFVRSFVAFPLLSAKCCRYVLLCTPIYCWAKPDKNRHIVSD